VLHVTANACDDPALLLLLLARGADPLAASGAKDLPADLAKLQRHAKAKKVLDEAAKAPNPVSVDLKRTNGASFL